LKGHDNSAEMPPLLDVTDCLFTKYPSTLHTWQHNRTWGTGLPDVTA